MSEWLLEVSDLRKCFLSNQGFLATLLGEEKGTVRAVDGVEFAIKKGEILAIVGESGCGKSTLGKLILRLLKPDSGKILFEGQDIASLDTKELHSLRLRIQMIFQDPYESLDPRARIYDGVAEPLIVNKLVKNEGEKRERVIRSMEQAGLVPIENYLFKYPHNLSGGERQRVGIATALVLEPELIVADEPTSMLDVSTQANILDLIQNLRRQRGLTFIFITHDLSLAYAISDRLAVMYLGRFVEMGLTPDVIFSPLHPYTKALVSVAPSLLEEVEPIILKGEIPNPEHIPPGCRFHPRCYNKIERCLKEEPQMEELLPGHFVSCFNPLK